MLMETVFRLTCYPKLNWGTRCAMFGFRTLKNSASAASRWVSSRRHIVNPKFEPEAPETVRRIPRKQFDAAMGGAKTVMRELSDLRSKPSRADAKIAQSCRMTSENSAEARCYAEADRCRNGG